VRVDFHLAAPRGERVYNIYMGVEWKENIIHEGPKERTFFQPLLDVWGACACLRWESEKDFIDLSGIKNQVTQEARRAQPASAPQELSSRAASVSARCFGSERDREEEALYALRLTRSLARSHLPLIVVRRN
jgi:hypothetical protein